MDQSTPTFKNNDLIWGKVADHPWWPGTICVNEQVTNKRLYRVDFFGYPQMQSFLPLTKIIKYEDYHKLEAAQEYHRTCPELKKAIAQASVLINTLQQSKSSSINKCATNFQIFESENTNVSSAKSETRTILDPNSSQEIPQFFFGFEQQKQHEKIKIKLDHTRYKSKLHKKKLNTILNKEERLSQLLKQYKLQIIPDVERKKEKYKQQKMFKFLYKILKRNFSRQKTIEIILANKQKIVNIKQFKTYIQDLMVKQKRIGQQIGNAQI